MRSWTPRALPKRYETLNKLIELKLTLQQYLDVMAARMGGDFLKAMKRMRKEKRDRHYIEQYFLGLDRIAAMKPTGERTERKVELMRPHVHQQWGINMGYLVR